MNKVKLLDTNPSEDITNEQIDKINKLTRRNLSKEEVYAFSLILCDNEIDRDFERFDNATLEQLSKLFVGATGIFDHNANTENQSARIFETEVIIDSNNLNSLGEPYHALKAWAYMVRCSKNNDLILEIDAGIKKEVSVGCAVKETICSICSNEQRATPCTHKKGEVYNGNICHYILSGATDAYEWSFVAVPAQKKAGVVKYFNGNCDEFIELEKFFAYQGNITITSQQRKSLAEQYNKLLILANAGEQYLESLRREVVKLTVLSKPQIEASIIESVVSYMDIPQLKAFRIGFSESASEKYPMPQLGRNLDISEEKTISPFKI